MLKRLITAVCILGLLVAFTGVALADVPGHSAQKVSARSTAPLDNDQLNKVDPPRGLPTGFQRSSSFSEKSLESLPAVALQATTPGGGDCFENVNYGLDALDACGAFFFNGFDNDGEKFATRFEVFRGLTGELFSTTLLIRQSTDSAAGGWDLEITVYDDNGGLPGNLLRTKVIPAAQFNHPFSNGRVDYFQTFIFDTPVAVPAAFHIAYAYIGGGDRFRTASTAPRFCGDFRGQQSSYFDPVSGTWLDWAVVFVEPESNFLTMASYCTTFGGNCDFANNAFGGALRHDLPGSGGNYWGWGAGTTLSGLAQRFVAERPESLQVVKISHRDQVKEGFPLGATGYEATSTNSYVVSIYPDAGGIPDVASGPLASRTLTGLAELYPFWGNTGSNTGPSTWDTILVDFSSDLLRVVGPYHVTIVPTSLNAADGFILVGIVVEGAVGALGSDATDGLGVLFDGSPWEHWDVSQEFIDNTSSFFPGFEPYDMKARVTYCRDQFVDCQTEILPDFVETWEWDVGPGSSAWAQRVTGNEVNRLEKFRAKVRVVGAAELDMVVWSDGGAAGAPGQLELYRQRISAPVTGWNEVVIPNGLTVFGDFYIGYEAFEPDPAIDEIVGYTEADDHSSHAGSPHRTLNGGVWFYDDIAGVWVDFPTAFGWTDNLMAEADYCAIPIGERNCTPGDDWATVGHDNSRSSGSSASVGDAWCDMTLKWNFLHSTFGINEAAPIIYDGMVIQAFTGPVVGEYVIFDLISGAQISTIPSIAGNTLTPGGNLRCTPTVSVIGGVPMLFVAGGTNASVLAYDISIPATPALIWAIEPSTGWKGHTNGMGTIRFGSFVVQNVGGTDVLYFSDDLGVVFAAEAATGNPYAGWFSGAPSTYTPVVLSGNPLRSGASDGAFLYYATFSSGPGDVYSIDAATGSIAWQLSTTGLQGATLFTGGTNESFRCGIAVSGEECFVSSLMSFPDNGVYYNINSLTGTINNVNINDRVWLSSPIVDVRSVTWPTYTTTIPSVNPAMIVSYARVDASVLWSNSSFFATAGDNRYRTQPAMSCEPDLAADIMFAGGESGYLGAFDNNLGTELFNRRIAWSSGIERIHGVSIATDSLGDVHVVMVDNQGGLYNLTKQTDRPRLEILADNVVQPVEFNSPSGLLVTFPAIYRNSGCADLVLDLVADAASNGGQPNAASGRGYNSLRDQFANSTANIADQLTAYGYEKWLKMNTMQFADAPDVLEERGELRDFRSSQSRVASAPPAFLIGTGGDVFVPAGGGFITAPGDTTGITVTVDGPLINRGPQSWFTTFQNTNDPDYWLNAGMTGANDLDPEIRMTLVGGCLLDTVGLNFGVGGGNFAPAFNTGRIAGRNAPLAAWPTIDGNVNVVWTGTYVYAASQQRLAVSEETWTAAYGTDWISLQADPNFCDLLCKPNLTSGVSLGAISADGFTYVPVLGEMACRSWVDSVEVFAADGDGWDWVNPSLGFDNDSTLGTATNSTIFAAVDEATSTGTLDATGTPVIGLLNNVVVDIMEITERNGNLIPNVGLGIQIDFDLNGDNATGGNFDTAHYDGSISTGWVGDVTMTDLVAGWIKLPFGCGETPMHATRGLEQGQSFWTIGLGWDSTYGYMNMPGFSHQDIQAGATDENFLFTLAMRDIQPSETFKLGAAYFQFSGLDSTNTSEFIITDVANLVNKWVGFGRGDVNNDNVINISDIIALAEFINFTGKPGPYPFEHLGDVDGTAGIGVSDVQYMVDFYFNSGPCPVGAWEL